VIGRFSPPSSGALTTMLRCKGCGLDVVSKKESPKDICKAYNRRDPISAVEKELAIYKDRDENWALCDGCNSWVKSVSHDDGELGFCESCRLITELRDEAAALRNETATASLRAIKAEADNERLRLSLASYMPTRSP